MKTPTQIKICGLTSIDEARVTVNLGADAIGLVFHEASPRNVDIAVATKIASAVGPFVSVVGLFVNRDKQFVDEVLKEVPLHVLQFHGSETPSYCEQFNRPYLKAIKVPREPDAELIQTTQDLIINSCKLYRRNASLLLDVASKKGEGGTGEQFDWDCIPQELINAKEKNASAHRPSWILAGGLDSENVYSAILKTRPFAVDVSSGVESVPGKKDFRKIEAFIKNVKRADATA